MFNIFCLAFWLLTGSLTNTLQKLLKDGQLCLVTYPNARGVLVSSNFSNLQRILLVFAQKFCTKVFRSGCMTTILQMLRDNFSKYFACDFFLKPVASCQSRKRYLTFSQLNIFSIMPISETLLDFFLKFLCMTDFLETHVTFS
jgi:hypothetical protein